MFITLVPDHLKHFVKQVHVFTAAQGTGDSDPNSRLHDVVIATLVLANNQVVTGSTVCQSDQTRNFELAGRKAVAKALPKVQAVMRRVQPHCAA